MSKSEEIGYYKFRNEQLQEICFEFDINNSLEESDTRGIYSVEYSIVKLASNIEDVDNLIVLDDDDWETEYKGNKAIEYMVKFVESMQKDKTYVFDTYEGYYEEI